jgi:hypothetical protein
MPKFFQTERAIYGGEKHSFRNVKFKKRDLDNSSPAEAGTILEIIPVHIKNPPVIQFIAYLENLSDSFSSQQTATQPFGRPDPYYMWKSNKRKISVTFSIPASSMAVALDNLNNLSWFLAALYPAYKDTQLATSIAASPLFRVRFSNLICSSTRDGQGLLGVIQNISVTPDVKQGFIGINPQNMGSSFANVEAKLLKEAGFDNSIREGKKLLIPKLMKVSFALDVVHDHALGWDITTGQWRGGRSAPRFPYDFGLIRDTTDTPSAGTEVSDDVQTKGNTTPGSIEAKSAAGAKAAVLGAGTVVGADPPTGVDQRPGMPEPLSE